jgi:NADP-dependent aldehyde dehydrogenase
MSSINPVFLFPAALETHAETIADGFVAALTLGAGQFCTNPGLIITVESPATDRFLARATRGIQQLEPQTMLTAAIAESYRDGLASHEQNPNIQLVAKGNTTDPFNCVAALFKTTREAFLADPSLREEVFGAAAIVVLCQSVTEFAQISQALEGQLTASVHVAPLDHDAATRLLPYLEDKAGRVIVNGFGTGVEVAHAIVHGGPFPATSDGRSTSVGSLAIQRFLRPVCYQDMPLAMLPEHLRAQL